MADFLDTNGLRLLWEKIKALVVGKADKVANAVSGNFAGLDSTGNLTDSGYSPSDLLELAVNVTYSELKSLRDGGNLIPGKWYRITDYTCSTIQEGTYSAGHKFDVIVRADDENHLNENAYAAHHEGDTYFQDCKLEAWELKYCLDNDTNRFAWAMEEYTSPDTHQPFLQTYYNGDTWIWVRYPTLDSSGKFAWVQDRYSNGYPINLYVENSESLDTTQVILTDTETPEIGADLLVNNQNTTKLINATYTNRGVVFYMKDEFDNIAWFDFKNILVTRTTKWFIENEDFLNSILGDEFKIPETDMLFYFLSWVDENGEVHDLSTLSETYFEDGRKRVFGNEIKQNISYTQSPQIPETTIIEYHTPLVGCSNNKFGYDCGYNTIFNSSSNRFGEACTYNIVYGNGNIFGAGSSFNKINGHGNSFGDSFFDSNINGDSNTFEKDSGVISFTGHNNAFFGLCNSIIFNVSINNCKFFGEIVFLTVEGTGGDSTSSVTNAIILGGILSDGGRTITFEKDIDRPQVACLDSNGQVVVYCVGDLAKKTSVVTLTGNSVTQELADNTIYQASILVSLTISIPNGVTSEYTSQINFASGSTATTLTAPNTILWRGDDVSNGSFVPVANKRYVISLCADGTYAFADVKGYAKRKKTINNE